MKRIFENAIKDLLTSILGSVAGVPMIIEGVTSKDNAKIVEGIAIFILGLVSYSKTK